MWLWLVKMPTQYLLSWEFFFCFDDYDDDDDDDDAKWFFQLDSRAGPSARASFPSAVVSRSTWDFGWFLINWNFKGWEDRLSLPPRQDWNCSFWRNEVLRYISISLDSKLLLFLVISSLIFCLPFLFDALPWLRIWTFSTAFVNLYSELP